MIEAAGPPSTSSSWAPARPRRRACCWRRCCSGQARVRYVPVDVSPSALAAGGRRRWRASRPVASSPWSAAIPRSSAFLRRRPARAACVLFLGSNIGNYDPDRGAALLAARAAPPRARGRASSSAPIGARARRMLLPAYDDAAGRHRALQQERPGSPESRPGRRLRSASASGTSSAGTSRASRVELYLESTRSRSGPIARASGGGTFAARRAHSHRVQLQVHAPGASRQLFAAAGFQWEQSWKDARRWFAVHLLRVPPAA